MDATQVYVSEFIGTAILMAFGSSCNAGLLLKNTSVLELTKKLNKQYLKVLNT